MNGGPAGEVQDPALLADALAGLSARPKSLPPKWLYDERGSELFERITALPEYHLTRTETEILRDNAGALAGLVPGGGALVELGSGASVKTRLLLEAGAHFGAYVPIDISAAFLERTAHDLRRRYPAIEVVPCTGDFTGPVALPEAVRGLPKVGFFPGSTIGNLAPEAARTLLARARGWEGISAFVLGVDMVKDEGEMVAAYDDAQGVTAAFIGNLLVRLNREAGADFDTGAFSYEASWTAGPARIDMRLVSDRAQEVRLPGARIAFAAGEAIHVSASRKYTRQSLAALVASAGWTVARTFADADRRVVVAVLVPGEDGAGADRPGPLR